MNKAVVLINVILFLLVIVSSVGGILFTFQIYDRETLNWTIQALAQDWVNLILVAPGLLFSGLMDKKLVKWNLIWLGLLVANLYSFIIYVFFVHFGFLFPVYTAILGVNFYLLVISVGRLNSESVKKSFREGVIRKVVAYLLILLGIFFYLVWMKDIFANIANPTQYDRLLEIGLFVNPVQVIDLALFLPGLIIAGVGLLRQKSWGYVLSGSLLVSLIVVSINIAAISVLFRLKGLVDDFGVMPAALVLALVMVVVAIRYLGQFSARSSK